MRSKVFTAALLLFFLFFLFSGFAFGDSSVLPGSADTAASPQVQVASSIPKVKEGEGEAIPRSEYILRKSAFAQRGCTTADPHDSCDFRWRAAIFESLEFLAIEHSVNRSNYRGQLIGRFFSEWARAVSNHRWDAWDDGDEFLVNYIGHPMSGAAVGYIQIQNDPKGAALELSASKQYVKSRLKAMAWITVYSTQWEIGPVSEASLGHLGNYRYFSRTGLRTNGTGWCDFVNTPIIGTALIIGEDALDKFVIKRIESHSKNRALLLGISVLTPARSVSNLLRFKAPWYRDSRVVGGWAGAH